MAKIQYDSPKASYFSVLADGKFHQTVDEGTEGARRREYEAKDGTKGVKYELVAQKIEGIITRLSIHEGEYGKNVQIVFGGESDEDTIIVSLSAQSGYGEDFLKKLPNIDTSKEVTLAPYSFTDDGGKKRKGITVYQDENKIQSYYTEEKKVGKKTTYITVNGYPKVDKKKDEKWDSDEWKLYFGTARKFLLSELKKHPLYAEVGTEKAQDEIDADEIMENL